MIGRHLRGYIWIAFCCVISFCWSCQAPGGCKGGSDARQNLTNNHGPKRIYVPEYFIYRRGKYEFVKGHYRTVLFPKVYVKRSMKGYVTGKEESASIR
jgi:hypothetical protein